MTLTITEALAILYGRDVLVPPAGDSAGGAVHTWPLCGAQLGSKSGGEIPDEGLWQQGGR